MFTETVFGIPWMALALVALALAAVYTAVDTGRGATGWRWFVLRLFHPLCWLCLGAAAFAMTNGSPLPREWAVGLGAAAGVLYLVFAVAWVGRRRR